MWWRARYDDIGHVCETEAATFITELQRMLVEILPITFVVDGTAYARGSIPVGHEFGPASFAGLRRAADDLDVPSDVQLTLRTDFQRLVTPAGTARTGSRGQPVSLATQAVAIFVAVHRNLPWTALSVPTDMITMRFDLAPPPSGGGIITCAPESEYAGRAGAGTPASSPGAPAPAASGGTGIGAIVFALGLVLVLSGKGPKI